MTNEAQLRIGDLLRTAADDAVPLVGGIDDASLGAPTPCAEYDVRALLNHLFSVVVNFQVLAAKGTPDFSETPDRVAAAGWREEFGAEAGKLVEAWSAPGAEEGTSGALGLPARTVGCMVLLDLTVHVWDLARAIGRTRTGPGRGGRARRGGGGMAPMARRMGVFGDAVDLPGDATAFERLLATTGRDPRAW